MTKLRKPRPMNWGDPQRAALGAAMLGQRAKKPVSGREWQSLLPPPQSASAAKSVKACRTLCPRAKPG